MRGKLGTNTMDAYLRRFDREVDERFEPTFDDLSTASRPLRRWPLARRLGLARTKD